MNQAQNITPTREFAAVIAKSIAKLPPDTRQKIKYTVDGAVMMMEALKEASGHAGA